jgi:hypothetical protein
MTAAMPVRRRFDEGIDQRFIIRASEHRAVGVNRLWSAGFLRRALTLETALEADQENRNQDMTRSVRWAAAKLSTMKTFSYSFAGIRFVDMPLRSGQRSRLGFFT